MVKISVIMGIYNCSSTLAESIDSIFAQTYSDFELIMCDDGSSDNTYSVAMKYKEKYPDRIILIKNEQNMGLNFTLNRCLELARGEYIARMDGDDISLPERFKTEVDFLDNNPEYAIVSCPMIFFDENGDFGTNARIPYPQITDFVRNSPFFCHAPCMVRRNAFLDVQGYTVDKRLLRYEDCNLWYKLYAKGYRGHNLSIPLYKMRDDQNAFKRRTFSSRMRSVYVQYNGFKLVNMPKKYYPYLLVQFIRSFCIGILPASIYKKLRQKTRLNK